MVREIASPRPTPLCVAAAGGVESGESFEHRFSIGGGDAGSVVGHGQHNDVLLAMQFDGDLRLRR